MSRAEVKVRIPGKIKSSLVHDWGVSLWPMHALSSIWQEGHGFHSSASVVRHLSPVSLVASPMNIAHQDPLHGILQKNNGWTYHGLLQGNFLTQRSNLCLLSHLL